MNDQENTKAVAQPILTDEILSKAGRALADAHAKVCNVNRDDNWKLYGNDFINDACIALSAIEADLRASLSAPVAAVAGSIGDDPEFKLLTDNIYCAMGSASFRRHRKELAAYIDSRIQSAAITGQKNGEPT